MSRGAAKDSFAAPRLGISRAQPLALASSWLGHEIKKTRPDLAIQNDLPIGGLLAGQVLVVCGYAAETP